MEKLIPKKRPLPDAYELLTAEVPFFLRDIDLSRKPDQKTEAKVLHKPAELRTKSDYDPLEQYDYFAQDPSAKLDNWKVLPQKRRKGTKHDWIKTVDTSRAAALGLEKKEKQEAPKKWSRWRE